jgi:hypothetical protein
VASLDVLDWQVALDDALAPVLPRALRRQAVREARRVVDSLAFRFAVLDERPLPEDLDYLRALEAIHPPARAAEVLARRRPYYARVRRRRLATTWIALGVVALAMGGLVYLATSEKGEDLVTVSGGTLGNSTTIDKPFTVVPGTTRLYVAGTVFLGKANTGNIEIRLKGPDGSTVWAWPSGEAGASVTDRGTYYIRENVDAPTPGAWRVLVDFNGAQGSAELTVRGITPAR